MQPLCVDRRGALENKQVSGEVHFSNIIIKHRRTGRKEWIRRRERWTWRWSRWRWWWWWWE
jgi:hypothetical protein